MVVDWWVSKVEDAIVSRRRSEIKTRAKKSITGFLIYLVRDSFNRSLVCYACYLSRRYIDETAEVTDRTEV